ncbi:MAG: indole-3-glycerol phosphate synthase TrpC [Syntrophomonadaceae bacterium]|nr:indole-3-glycerol phosphate synthase TrpC [Syntrophomonadaceae bacterium]MDD3889531.1 indole-3-glycerol phosphate synthase TrpC [Syntrophomonadaceae bacterium]MDD4549896.1 indole-3-glycerol phosphate synthase TrpC [Syntrophomonadaceae bacterium]
MLERILAAKKIEVEKLKNELNPDSVFQSKLSFNPITYFKRKSKKVGVIAEVKKASPVKGILCKDFDPVKLAENYVINGATAISVISDQQFFGGDKEYIRKVRHINNLPVLRKDFIIDEIQLLETAILGADMVLIIAALHDYGSLLHLTEKSLQLGLQPMMEIHDREELSLIEDLPVNIIGINNRNLKSFKVDLNTSLELGEYMPGNYIKISESGIKSKQDMQLLADYNFDAALIGEALVSSSDPGKKLKELLAYQELDYD